MLILLGAMDSFTSKATRELASTKYIITYTVYKNRVNLIKTKNTHRRL